MITGISQHTGLNRFILACILTSLMLFVFCLPPAANGADGVKDGCYQTLAEDDLVCSPKFCPGNFYAGGSVSFRLAPGHEETKLSGPPQSWLTMTIMDRDIPVLDLPDSFYVGYAHLTLGPTDYWIIREYTGGMHCCTRYHFFSRPAPGKNVLYLGATAGSDEGLAAQPFSCRDGSLYLEDRDTRFLYFHTPYAQSLLLFPRHYQITPFTLSVDNTPFRDQYRQLDREVEAHMEKIIAARQSTPAALLLDKGKDADFSDLLGQLLVKRTILYINAGETTRAWTTLAEDVRRYYRQDTGLAQIRSEIDQILAEPHH